VALLGSLGGADAYRLSGQPFAHNFTCLVGNMQYLGIPSDPCNGLFPDKFNTMQYYLAAVGIGNYNHENMDTTPRDMIEYDCYNLDHQEGPGGKIVAEPSPWYCSQALTFSPAFGASICQNKFTSHALNPNYPADESLVQVRAAPPPRGWAAAREFRELWGGRTTQSWWVGDSGCARVKRPQEDHGASQALEAG
jgi:hypothetical protein